MPPLEPHQIKICCVFYDEVRDPELLSSYRALLSAEERALEMRFRHAKQRHRYLLTRALVRTELSRHVQIPPALWRFENNQYGRPFIENSEAKHTLIFNLTHTQELIVLGIRIAPEAMPADSAGYNFDLNSGFNLGIDVENLRRVAPP